MNINAKIAIEKKAHPERFCPEPRCLYRTAKLNHATQEREGGGRCPRHGGPAKKTPAPGKPAMPRDYFKPEIEFPVPVSLDLDMENFSSGFMFMGVTEVELNEGGRSATKLVCRLGVDIQGLAVHCTLPGKPGHPGRTYSIEFKSLWPIFEAAEEKYKRQLAGVVQK